MEPLLVDVVYFYPRDNAESHHTTKYEVLSGKEPKTTVLRRGQPFNGVVRFTKPFDEDMDLVQLVFTLGDKPQYETTGSMFIRRNVAPNKQTWSAKLVAVQQQNKDVSFEVSSPVTLPIGRWSLRVVTRRKGGDDRRVYNFDQDIYFLYNPWNVDDQTYMEDSKLLQEYVLNDVGKLWVGPVKSTLGKPWVYGQFDAVVLPACMFMLERAGLPHHQRGDPIKMSRAISRIVNSNDDGGVLVGRWDGHYEHGTTPSEWTGSVDILQQYLKTQKVVRYGQCWIFAGVVTTVCRALGLPCRSVSNIVSAHDANRTLTVDKYYTETMEELHYDPNNPDGPDSIWNYHVWNDVWMARPDLPEGFGGWQAIDATPQEISSGMFQCGPASLKAIKQGNIGLGYDVEFMLSSVNADLMRWRTDPDAENGFALVETDNYQIGRMILTKKPYVFDPKGDADRDIITDQYKFPEGTRSERMALMKGVNSSERAKRYYSAIKNLKNDVTFKLHDLETVPVGEQFRVTVDIKNNSNEFRNITASLSAASVFYSGKRAGLIRKVEDIIKIAPGDSEKISILVKGEEYLPKLVEYCNMKISAVAFVQETKQSWADDDDFQVLMPRINIKLNEDLILDQPATAVLSFVNPLASTLTDCEFIVTSSGIAGRTLRRPLPDVKPKAVVSMKMQMQPNKTGSITIVAALKSDKLKDITGAATAEVFEG
ncbi:hemocyte protein-glutamine gamma-glutamyltransferase-like [Plodia interpunctella]|uniref:hemocyte protein-glutamine gamma-glutamyltransferase-like n=1 Tax=Plodia interpunctella TaxID=58824 RepID=UPI002368649D|nr:hemocyte protein-glutamine gamma-glutamyltransferase-like [Plodia interpunctella]